MSGRLYCAVRCNNSIMDTVLQCKSHGSTVRCLRWLTMRTVHFTKFHKSWTKVRAQNSTLECPRWVINWWQSLHPLFRLSPLFSLICCSIIIIRFTVLTFACESMKTVLYSFYQPCCNLPWNLSSIFSLCFIAWCPLSNLWLHRVTVSTFLKTNGWF